MPGGSPGNPRTPRAKGAGHPAVVVNGAAAHDLEILGQQSALGLWIVKSVSKTHSVDRVLGHTVNLEAV